MAKENVKREIIVIEGKYKLVENNLDWQVYQFNEGGEEVRVPSTNEIIITKPRWVAQQAYFNKQMHLKAAIQHIAKLAVLDQLGEVSSLQEVLNQYQLIADQIEEMSINVLPH